MTLAVNRVDRSVESWHALDRIQKVMGINKALWQKP